MDLLREYLMSKKARAAILGTLAGALLKFGLHVDTETIGVLLSPILTYIVGQGLADRGKEAALINAVTQKREADQSGRLSDLNGGGDTLSRNQEPEEAGSTEKGNAQDI